MSSRIKAGIVATAIGCAGLGAFAANGWGDDPPVNAGGGEPRLEVVRPALEAGEPSAARAGEAKRAKKAKTPRVTNLITTDPVPVGINSEVVAELECKRSQGIPLDGGAIAPPAPEQVAISVISRFNPNPPFEDKPQTFYVGVRNLSLTAPAEFRATLVCAKGISE
jgi:hypothetical protein